VTANGAAALPDLERELSRLKDFQRRTVDYVFRRLYRDDPPTTRFLIADEVGLGKTLVARGIVARALHHLHRKGIDRIDVVYVCSNQDIARQNLHRLNVTGREEIALPTRLTLLPTQIHDLDARHVNLVSLTPGTSLETTKSRQGRKEERVLLFKLLADRPEISRGGLRNLLQATVHRENWERYLGRKMRIDDTLARDFLDELRADAELWEDLVRTARDFRWRTDRTRIPPELNDRRYCVIGRVRGLMAEVCVEALEPDLIILDEFQRFRDLLDGDTEAAGLTRQLLNYQEGPGHRARVLLLSATPYRMLSLYGDEEDHHEDFLRTCRFLFGGSEAEEDALKRDLRRYRRSLYRLGRREEDSADPDPGRRPERAADEARRRVQERLRSVMVRTERAAGTGSRDAMLEERTLNGRLEPADLDQARALDQVATSVEAHDPIEYWKSAPYLLNAMRGYQLKERVAEARDDPPPDLVDALARSEAHLLDPEDLERYRELDPGNARLRALLADTIEAGQWKLLWMPPSLPYLEPSGPFAQAGDTTKALVFSKWRVVPEAIAALLSYGAERRMLSGRSDVAAYSELHDGASRPLEFTIREGRPSGMNPLMLLYPSPALAEAGDPLRLAAEQGGGRLDRQTALEEVGGRIRRRLREAGLKLKEEGGAVPDERWYRVVLARLDAHRHPEMEGWAASSGGWRSAGDGFGEGFPAHVEQFARGFGDDRTLGFAPDDVARVLAELALASPAVCAYRALRRVSGVEDPTDPELLARSVQVADGFRTLLHRPETVAFLQSREGDVRYWERALKYGLEGNLQAVLDEYAHVLRDSLGLVDAPSSTTIQEVADEMTGALTLGAGRIHLDEVRARQDRIDIERFRVRSRFAVRFGHLRNERGETVARRGGVRDAFNSPFRPFVLATTSIGQEGLDFHTYCHAVYHWNLPGNPVDLEQREGRIHRYKGHAIRKNLADNFGLGPVAGREPPGDGRRPRDASASADRRDPWRHLFRRAADERPEDVDDLVPYWVYDEGDVRVERRVPMLPFSRETSRLGRLKSSLAVYRMVFGQPRQEDLLAYLRQSTDGDEEAARELTRYRISLAPPEVEVEQKPIRGASTSAPAGKGRETADERRPATSAELVDAIVRDVQSFAPRHRPREKDKYIGFEVDGSTDYFVVLKPREYGLRIDARLQEDARIVARLKEAGFNVYPFRPYTGGPGVYPIKVTPARYAEDRELVQELLWTAYKTRTR
jgi:hypothetical protein